MVRDCQFRTSDQNNASFLDKRDQEDLMEVFTVGHEADQISSAFRLAQLKFNPNTEDVTIFWLVVEFLSTLSAKNHT